MTMRKPNRPPKPKKPVKPKKMIDMCQRNIADLDCGVVSIAELRSIAERNNANFEECFVSVKEDYGGNVDFRLLAGPETVDNPNYDYQLKKYERDKKTYSNKEDVYKKRLAAYEERLLAWQAKEDADKVKRYNRMKKQLEKEGLV